MRHIGAKLTNLNLWYFLAGVGLLFIPALLFISREPLFQFLNCCILTAAAGALSVFFMNAWRAMRLPVKTLDSAQLTGISLTILLIGLFWMFADQWVWRWLERPVWLSDAAQTAVSRLIVLLGLFGIMVNRYAHRGIITPDGYGRGMLLMLGAIFTALLLITFGWG